MNQIEDGLKSAVSSAVTAAFDIDFSGDQVVIEIPRDKSHGDYACNTAMQLTRTLHRNPRVIAEELMKHFDSFEGQAKVNLPPRIRMAALYAVSQSVNGRVANTCNLSEDWVGYNTKYGDGAGDFSPLSHFTVQEVKAIGRAAGLPDMFVDKVPIDGLCGLTDEDNLGFTYAVLDRYIREGVCEDAETKAKIDRMHKRNLFKLQPMPTFEYEPEK